VLLSQPLCNEYIPDPTRERDVEYTVYVKMPNLGAAYSEFLSAKPM